MQSVEEVSYPDMLSDEEFLERTRLVEVEPSYDPHLAFRMRIPKSWNSSEDIGLRNFVVSQKVVGEVARYFSPPSLDLRSSVSISAMDMEQRITAKNWFVHHVFSQGFSLEGMTVLHDDHVIGQYVMLEDDVPYRVRASAVATGKRVVMAQYYVPLANVDREAPLQAAVIDTFELTNPDEDFYFASDTYEFLDIVSFEYPLTWELRAPVIRDIERMNAQLIDVRGEVQLKGQIDVLVLSHDSPLLDVGEEIKKIREEFTKRTQFEFGPILETREDFEYDPSIDSAIVEIYPLQSERRLIGYEYWFGLLNDDGFYSYLVTMVTPSRSSDFYTWAQNIEIYQFVLKSFRPGSSSL
ncbi:MAG: hypothetical protein EOM26_09115 [Alphaproteobacteria bacterium]|nr:hypothetical protein [Alphaproteobacteria bacterium]